MLSKRLRDLLDAVTPRKPVPAIGKGEKLVQGADGVWRLEVDGERFAKSAPAKDARIAAFVKSILEPPVTRRGVRHVMAVKGGFSKRAPQFPISESEMQGAAPVVPAFARPRNEPGLSNPSGLEDEKIQELDPRERFVVSYLSTARQPIGTVPRC